MESVLSYLTVLPANNPERSTFYEKAIEEAKQMTEEQRVNLSEQLRQIHKLIMDIGYTVNHM